MPDDRESKVASIIGAHLDAARDNKVREKEVLETIKIHHGEAMCEAARTILLMYGNALQLLILLRSAQMRPMLETVCAVKVSRIIEDARAALLGIAVAHEMPNIPNEERMKVVKIVSDMLEPLFNHMGEAKSSFVHAMNDVFMPSQDKDKPS